MPDDVISTIVTKRGEVPHDTTATTPASIPSNMHVITMHWSRIVFVRAARVYVQTVTGLLTAAGLGADSGMFPNELGPLLLSVLQLGLAPVVMSVLLNTGELLGRVDVNFPQLRA